jgi:hypothetical protein
MHRNKQATLTEIDLGRLYDAALDVILTHRVRSRSIDVEMDLWHAFEQAIHRENRLTRWLRLGGPRAATRQDRLADLARAALEVAQKHLVFEPGVEVEVDLLFALQAADDGARPMPRRPVLV